MGIVVGGVGTRARLTILRSEEEEEDEARGCFLRLPLPPPTTSTDESLSLSSALMSCSLSAGKKTFCEIGIDLSATIFACATEPA